MRSTAFSKFFEPTIQMSIFLLSIAFILDVAAGGENNKRTQRDYMSPYNSFGPNSQGMIGGNYGGYSGMGGGPMGGGSGFGPNSNIGDTVNFDFTCKCNAKSNLARNMLPVPSDPNAAAQQQIQQMQDQVRKLQEQINRAQQGKSSFEQFAQMLSLADGLDCNCSGSSSPFTGFPSGVFGGSSSRFGGFGGPPMGGNGYGGYGSGSPYMGLGGSGRLPGGYYPIKA